MKTRKTFLEGGGGGKRKCGLRREKASPQEGWLSDEF